MVDTKGDDSRTVSAWSVICGTPYVSWDTPWYADHLPQATPTT